VEQVLPGRVSTCGKREEVGKEWRRVNILQILSTHCKWKNGISWNYYRNWGGRVQVRYIWYIVKNFCKCHNVLLYGTIFKNAFLAYNQKNIFVDSYFVHIHGNASMLHSNIANFILIMEYLA
jgi:hypothetical protein